MRLDFLVDVDFDIDFVSIDETIKEDIYLRGYQRNRAFKLNIMRDLPGYIPRKLLCNKNFLSVLNISENKIFYYRSIL